MNIKDLKISGMKYKWALVGLICLILGLMHANLKHVSLNLSYIFETILYIN